MGAPKKINRPSTKLIILVLILIVPHCGVQHCGVQSHTFVLDLESAFMMVPCGACVVTLLMALVVGRGGATPMPPDPRHLVEPYIVNLDTAPEQR
jgi:hypothetical protein